MARLKPDVPFIHPDSTSAIASSVPMWRSGGRIAYSSFGDYSYCDRYAGIANAQIGKFSNIAAFTRIGATDHPLETSCHHYYRSDDYWDDAERDEAFFERRRACGPHRP